MVIRATKQQLTLTSVPSFLSTMAMVQLPFTSCDSLMHHLDDLQNAERTGV